MEYMAATHQGRRSNNEDALGVDPALGLFVVADGMGGYDGGEVASRIAVDTIQGFFRRNADDREATWPYAMDRALSFVENLLGIAVRLAHKGVCLRKQGRLAEMGTTVAALALEDGSATMAHVGDSRIYRLRGGVLEQLTRDHSLYAELVAGGMTNVDRESFPMTNVITRALGMGDARADLRREPVQPGDVFLLCTDGLIERVDDATIGELLDRNPPREACPKLVNLAYERGARDNITAIVVRIVG